MPAGPTAGPVAGTHPTQPAAGSGSVPGSIQNPAGSNSGADPDQNSGDEAPEYYAPILQVRIAVVPLSLSDKDGDDILDVQDNCPDAPNPDQLDSDGDGRGNACDNCKYWAYESFGGKLNPDQSDQDGDGIGDICDNCISRYNPTQQDIDRNGEGDHCENVARI